MANESFIQGAEIVGQINDAFYKHLAVVKENVNAINQLGSSYGKLPSDYLKTIQAITDAQKKQIETEKQLTSVKTVAAQKTQEEITNNRILARNASLMATANSTLAGSYQRLVAQQQIAAKSVQDLIARGRTATQTQKQYDAEIRVAQSEFQKLNTRVTSANRAVNRFHDNVGNYPTKAVNGIRDLVGAFGLVGGVTAFAAITKDIFNTTRELQSLDLALRQVLGSQEKAAESQQFLSRISEAYGIEINGLTKSYTGFLAAAKNALDANYITANQINQIFESVSKASGAMGLSVEQQEGAFLALQQMISKGNVQAEEIRGQLAERLPGAFGILAKSMGVTETQLNKLLKDGKVLAAEVLPAFAKELEKAYGVENIKRVETLAAGTSRLKNEWTGFIRSLNEGNGVLSKFFTSLINQARETLKFYKELNTTEKVKQESALNEAYRTRLAYLKALDPEQKKLQANDILSVNPQNIKQYEEQNKLLRERQKILKSDATELQNSDPRQTVGIVKTLNDEYDASASKIKANATQIAILTGQMRAATEALKGEDKVVKQSLEDDGKVKRQKADIDYLKEVYDLRKANAENEIAAQNNLMNNEEKNYSVRLEAANNYFFQKEALNKLDYEEQLRLNDLNYKNQKEQYTTAINEGKATYSNLQEIQYQHILRKEKIDADYEGKKADLAIDSAKKLKGVLDSIEDKSRTNTVDAEELENIRQLNLELLNASTNTSYAKFKELEERKTKIVEDANDKRTQIELQRVSDQIKALGQDEKNSQVYQDLRSKEISLTKKLSDSEQERLEKSKALTLELKKATDEYLKSFTDLGKFGFESLNKFLQIDENGKSPFQNLLDGADSLGEKFSVTFNAIGDVAKDAFAFMNQNSQAAFDAEYTRLEQRRDIALKFAGENREAQEEINKQYDDSQREIKQRELKAQKEQALFNAVINTAQGVTAALGTANIPLAILIGALGAAQIAFIASQQIPAFADGGTTGTAGNILVNDAPGSNYKEVVVTPGGKTIKPSGRNQVMNVPKGTRIFKNYSEHEAELNKVLANAGIAPSSGMLNRITGGVSQSQGLTKSDLMDVMKQTVGSMSSSAVNVSLDRNGFDAHVENGHNRMQLRNNHLELRGRTFGKG